MEPCENSFPGGSGVSISCYVSGTARESLPTGNEKKKDSESLLQAFVLGKGLSKRIKQVKGKFLFTSCTAVNAATPAVTGSSVPANAGRETRYGQRELGAFAECPHKAVFANKRLCLLFRECFK